MPSIGLNLIIGGSTSLTTGPGGAPPGPPTDFAVKNRNGAYVKNRDGAQIVADPTPRT